MAGPKEVDLTKFSQENGKLGVCPIMSTSYIGQANDPTGLLRNKPINFNAQSPCIGDACQLWDAEGGRCAIKTMSLNLSGLLEKLTEQKK